MFELHSYNKWDFENWTQSEKLFLAKLVRYHCYLYFRQKEYVGCQMNISSPKAEAMVPDIPIMLYYLLGKIQQLPAPMSNVDLIFQHFQLTE